MSTDVASGYEVPRQRIDPIVRLLLIAVYDENNIWSKLGGMRYIVKHIWEYTQQFNRHHWAKHITFKDPALHGRYHRIGFPKPTGININMMPFVMEYRFEGTKLPLYLEKYFNRLIRPCLECDWSQKHRICFLTIHESIVEKGKTQRRPGLHIENPGNIRLNEEDLTQQELAEIRNGGGHTNYMKVYGGWGMAAGTTHTRAELRDGIYVASTVDGTCAAWNCQVTGNEVIGHYGDIEHLRSCLVAEKRSVLKANQLYWMTDRTPHEALPMQETGWRQFFRLVTYNVSTWHEQHNTANPNGVAPDPKITRIIKSSKFAQQEEK